MKKRQKIKDKYEKLLEGEIKRVIIENADLKAKNEELKDTIDFLEEMDSFCGEVIVNSEDLEYQNLIRILLKNNYCVTVEPILTTPKLRIVIREK